MDTIINFKNKNKNPLAFSKLHNDFRYYKFGDHKINFIIVNHLVKNFN